MEEMLEKGFFEEYSDDFAEEELKVVSKILELQLEMDFIELKESFKLGFKEAYIYFESMDMLKI